MTPQTSSGHERLAGRRAVVVGVGSSIGAACAQVLTTHGATIIAVDPDVAATEAAVRLCGPSIIPMVASVSCEEDAGRVAAHCRETWGVLDILIHCGSAMETWPVAEDAVETMLGIATENLAGPLAYTRALRGLLAASERGAVVLLGSIDGLHGNPNVPGYSMGKAGLVALTHILARSFGAEGTRVNCVAAAGLNQNGSGAPDMERIPGDLDLALRLTPLGRMPSPVEIATVFLFLASDEASYVTGAVLPVDGGRIAATPGTY